MCYTRGGTTAFASAFIVTVWAISIANSMAQSQPTAYEMVKSLHLDSTKTKVIVFFSANCGRRAIELSHWYEVAYSLFEDSCGVSPDVRIAALNEEDWTKTPITSPLPYGMPWTSVHSTPPIIFFPGVAEKGFFNLPIEESAAPLEVLSELSSMGFSFEFMSEHLVDLIGIHELGHVFEKELHIIPRQNWFGEFLAGYFLTLFTKYKNPSYMKMARLYMKTQEAIYPPTGPPKHTSLEDFEKLYFNVGPENYGWYQGKFQQRIDEMVDRHGFGFISEIKKMRLYEEPKIDVLLAKLEKIAPGFAAWSKTFK